MLEQPQRVDQFKAEIAEMKLPDPASGRDRLLLRAGAALMVAGRGAGAVGLLHQPRHHERRSSSATRMCWRWSA